MFLSDVTFYDLIFSTRPLNADVLNLWSIKLKI